jgi:hypothetical protein
MISPNIGINAAYVTGMRDANETVRSILENTASYADQSDAINEAIGKLAVTEQHIREYHQQTA